MVPAANRLYVLNSTWNRVTVAKPSIAVIDTSTNTFKGQLQPPVASGQIIVEAGLNQRRAAFLNPATNKVYVGYTGGGNGMIVVVDAATDSISQTALIPGGIETMQFNPATNKIYIVQQSVATTTQILVYDVNTLAQVAAIGGVDNAAFDGPPLAVNPLNNKIYTAAPGAGMLVIDGSRDAVEATASLPAEIGDIAVNPVNSKVYAGFTPIPQTMWVVDGTSDQLIATVNTVSLFGDFVIDAVHNIVYPGLGISFQVDGFSNLLENGPVFGNFAPPVNSNCSAISGTGLDFSIHNWYAGCDGTLIVADSLTGAYKNTVPVNYVTSWGAGIVNPLTHVVYMISNPGNSVTALDPVSLKPTLIQLGNFPISIATDRVLNRVFVADGPSNAAVVIDGGTNNVLAKIFAETQHPGSSASSPVGIAADITNSRYVFMEQLTAVELDSNTNAPVGNYNPGFKGNGTPNPAGFKFATVNQNTNKMYTSDGSNLYMSDLSSSTYTQLSATACTVAGLAANSANNTVLAAESCQNGGLLEVYDGFTAALLNSVPLNAFIPATSTAGSMLLNPVSNKLYIVNNGITPTTEVFNAVTFAHLATIANVNGTLAANTTLHAIYGTFTGAGGGVAVIDGNTDTLSSTFGAGIVVSGLAVNEATNMIYVGDSSQGTVNVFLGDAPAPGGFSISGRVLSGSGTGVAGITITSTGPVNATTVTDSNGLFTLFGIQAGTYTIAPATAGFFYGPLSQTVTVTTASLLNVNFNALTTPIAVTGLSLAPWTTIGPGVASTATVTINQPAPAGGITLTVTASNKAVKAPATVTVAAGSTSATFTVQGNSVSATTPVTVTAGYQGSFAAQASSASANMTVSPTDSLHITSATWSSSTQILTVAATSTNAQAILTMFLASNNQNLGTLNNLGGGNYSLQVLFNTGTPASVNVKSNLGGSTGQGVKIVP